MEITMSIGRATMTRKAKQIYAKALGGAAFPPIAKIAFGDGTGYINADYTIRQPPDNITQIPGEFLQVATDVPIYPEYNAIEVAASFSVADKGIANKNIAMFGLYDSAGNLLAVHALDRLLLLSKNLTIKITWTVQCP